MKTLHGQAFRGRATRWMMHHHRAVSQMPAYGVPSALPPWTASTDRRGLVQLAARKSGRGGGHEANGNGEEEIRSTRSHQLVSRESVHSRRKPLQRRMPGSTPVRCRRNHKIPVPNTLNVSAYPGLTQRCRRLIDVASHALVVGTRRVCTKVLFDITVAGICVGECSGSTKLSTMSQSH